MKNKKIQIYISSIFFAIIAVFFLSNNSEAAINSQINYQGKLTDTSGVAEADGNYNMIISIYDAASGGNCLWTARGTCGTPTARSVSLLNGIFSIMLGEAGDNVLTGLDFNAPYYLGVTVGSDAEMTPRKPIGAAAYAFNSSMLNGLSSATSGANAHILATDSSGNATISGSTYFNGTTYYVNSSGTGNLNGLTLAGDVAVNGNDITSTGALAITPASGNNLNVTLAGTGDFAVNTNNLYVDTSAGNVGIGTASPTATLHIKAGTAMAGTAPLKFIAGTNLTAAEVGAVEWDGTNLFITQTSGPTRKTIAYTTDIHNAVTLGTANGLSLATQQLSLGLASLGVTGALSGTDWNTFNGKENALTFSTGLARTANTITGNLSTGVSGGQTLIGSTSTNSGLTIKATTGVGTTGADIIFQVGNNGATEAMRILNSGNVGVRNSSPSVALHIGTTTPTNISSTSNSLMVSGALEVAGAAYLGPMEFPTNSGAISWIDLPVSASATPNAVESYTASVGGTGILTVYGLALGSGSGGIVSGSGRVGIGDTTPDTTLKIAGSLCVKSDANNCAGSTAGTIYATNTTVAGADYAEYFYTNDIDLKSGEIVCVDVVKANSVKRCERSGDNDVMGVVSTNPSIVGNGNWEDRANDPNYKIIGMIGQVPGLVSTENGFVKIGDNLTAASDGGYMRKANAGESTVGVAMENFSGDKGKIQVLISRRNQSLTVEKVEQAVAENIAKMNIQDKIDVIVNQTAENLNNQILNLSSAQQTNFSSMGAEISSIQNMQAKLADQMNLLEIQAKTATDFIVNLNVADIVYKDSLGNVNLLGGKITSQDIEVINSIKAKDIEASNNLKGKNLELGADVSGNGKIKAGQMETDPILTKQAFNGAKIYITPKDSTEGKTLYYDEKDIKEGESFTVKFDPPALGKDVEFNWLIIK